MKDSVRGFLELVFAVVVSMLVCVGVITITREPMLGVIALYLTAGFLGSKIGGCSSLT